MKKPYINLFLKLGFVAYIIISILYLDKYPTVWIDDSQSTEPAWCFIQTGDFVALSGWAGDDVYIPILAQGRLFYLSKIIFFELTKELSPFISRFPSFIFGMIALMLMYNLANKLFNRPIAFFSTAWLAFTHKFIFSSHDSRPETMLLVFILLSIYIFLKNLKQNSSFLWFVLGTVMSLSCDVHPPGIILFFMIPGLYLRFRKEINIRRFIYILPGIFIGALWFIIVRIPREINILVAQWNVLYGGSQPPILETLNPVKLFLIDFQKYYSFFWEARMHRNMFLLAVWIIAIVYALRKREYGQKICLTILFCAYLFYLLVSGNKSSCYLIFVFPFIYMLVAKLIYDLAKNKGAKKMFGWMLFSSLCLFYLFETGYILFTYKDSDYGSYINKLLKYVPNNSIVHGESAYWYGFIARGFPYYSRFTEGSSGINLKDTVSKRKIDYIIYSDTSDFWKHNKESNRLYLENECELVGEVEDNFYGGPLTWSKGNYETEIYKVNK